MTESRPPKPHTGASDSRNIVIIGGGIAGLSAAHRLLELSRDNRTPLRVRLFEATPRLGGNIRTDHLDGYLLEGGPDALVTQKPAGFDLCRRLGLEHDLVAPHPSTTGLQVVHRGRVQALPPGFAMLAPTRLAPFLRSSLFSWPGKLRIAAEPLIPARRSSSDESLRNFVLRRFGREAYARVAQPILGGLFLADTDSLSAGASIPRLLAMERRRGRITGGLRAAARSSEVGAGQLTPRLGMAALVESLADHLPCDWVQTDAPIESVNRDVETQRWTVEVRDSDSIVADAVVLACPAFVAARLLRELDGGLATALDRLGYASCATVSLVYERSAVRGPVKGHGFFVPRAERMPILACNYVSEKYDHRAPAGHVTFRAFLGGAHMPEVLHRSDSDLVDLAHRALADLHAIDRAPVVERVYRYPRSMPQFDVGDARRVEEIRQRSDAHRGLVFAGGTLGAIGLPDCITSGELSAVKAYALAAAPRPND